MKSFQVAWTAVVQAENEREAIRFARAELATVTPTVALLGYVAEGTEGREVLPYAAPPEGYRVHRVVSTYYGSHPEYGEGDETFYLAVPAGGELSAGFGLSHGHHGSGNVAGAELLPAGTLAWEAGELGEWAPVAELIGRREHRPAV